MPNLDLLLANVQDNVTRENFQRIQDFMNSLGTTQKQLQACEIFMTGNVSGAKIAHKLGGIPLDVILTRLIAPSAARLTFRYSDFTNAEVVFDVSGLTSGQNLSARFLVGTIPDVVTLGSVVRASTETQELRSKF